MTTADLLDALNRFPGVMTIDDVARRFHAPRRAVEETIQQARLEGHPVITTGGLRLARTSEEAFTVYRALRRRMQSQLATAWAVRSAAMLMQRGERAAALRAITEAQSVATHRARPAAAPAPGQTELFGGTRG